MKTKLYTNFSAALMALFALSGCGKSDAVADATPSTAPASAASTAPAAGKPTTGRVIAITANDTMKFNVVEIRAKAGEALAVTLVNEGTVPKFSMGHNWVLLALDADLNAFANDSAMAAATEYVPVSFKAKVLAATKLLGPKESDTTLFYAPKTLGSYPFICAFPGHMQVGMKGVLIVE